MKAKFIGIEFILLFTGIELGRPLVDKLRLFQARGGGGGGGGVLPIYNGLYGEAPPERGTFFSLQVYKRVGISQV